MHAPLYRKPRHTVNGRNDSPPLPKPQLTISAKSSAPRVSGALLAEESDTYARVVARLSPHWRVIVCRDGLQWVLQARRGQRNGLPRWSSRFFYRSREGLVIGCHRYAADVGGDPLVILLRLPEVFPAKAGP
jgi:hypothetical protein